MIHDDAELLAAGAVLDDLAPDERASYAAHRARCAECRRVELELDHVLADLALVVPERVPPPDLFGAIRRSMAGGTAPGVEWPAAVATAAPVVPFRRPARAPLLAAVGVAAALALVAAGLGIRTTGLERDLDAAAARLASLESRLAEQGEAMTVAMHPAHVTVALHGDALAPNAEAAVVFVPGQAASWIVARNLPATPAGHGYQLWYADDAGVHPLQTMPWDGTGTFVAPITVDLADSAAVMITLETAGGARGEPGPQVVFGEL